MKNSPFRTALKPTLVFIGLLGLIYIAGGGEKGGALFQILGLPWSFFAQYLSYEQESLKFFLMYEGGALINVFTVYMVSALLYSRKRDF